MYVSQKKKFAILTNVYAGLLGALKIVIETDKRLCDDRGMKDKCKFCGEYVNLNLEGATYKDGTCAHEECHDGEEFRHENAVELQERGE